MNEINVGAIAPEDSAATVRNSDMFEEAHVKIVGGATVLERLFESMAVSASGVDIGHHRDAEFFRGLAWIAKEVAESAMESKAANDQIFEAWRARKLWESIANGDVARALSHDVGPESGGPR